MTDHPTRAVDTAPFIPGAVVGEPLTAHTNCPCSVVPELEVTGGPRTPDTGTGCASPDRQEDRLIHAILSPWLNAVRASLACEVDADTANRVMNRLLVGHPGGIDAYETFDTQRRQ